MDRTKKVSIIDLICPEGKMGGNHADFARRHASGGPRARMDRCLEFTRPGAGGKLYAKDAEMTSDKIQALGFDSTGTLESKAKIRIYWTKALTLLPDLHFTLIDLFISPDSMVVFYANERGAKICEYLRLDAAGKIVLGSANHLAH
jgi:hypothetical protein